MMELSLWGNGGMAMFRPTKRVRPGVSGLYVLAVLGILYVMLPRLPHFLRGQAGVFTIVWVSFALLVMGANLWFVLGADKERKMSRSRYDLSSTKSSFNKTTEDLSKQNRVLRG